jgi:hypothetical protein
LKKARRLSATSFVRSPSLDGSSALFLGDGMAQAYRAGCPRTACGRALGSVADRAEPRDTD